MKVVWKFELNVTLFPAINPSFKPDQMQWSISFGFGENTWFKFVKIGSWSRFWIFSWRITNANLSKCCRERNIVEQVNKIAPKFQEGLKAFSSSPIVGEVRICFPISLLDIYVCHGFRLFITDVPYPEDTWDGVDSWDGIHR